MKFKFRYAAPDYRDQLWYWWDAPDGRSACIPRDEFWRGEGTFFVRRPNKPGGPLDQFPQRAEPTC